MPQTHTPYEIERSDAAPEFSHDAEAEQKHHVGDDKPTLEDIAREAYAIYLANGAQDGRDMEDWLEAERRLVAQGQSKPAQQGGAVLQHGNGDSQQRATRLKDDRRRLRVDPPKYIPV